METLVTRKVSIVLCPNYTSTMIETDNKQESKKQRMTW